MEFDYYSVVRFQIVKILLKILWVINNFLLAGILSFAFYLVLMCEADQL